MEGSKKLENNACPGDAAWRSATTKPLRAGAESVMKKTEGTERCGHCGCQGQQTPDQAGCENCSMPLMWPKPTPCSVQTDYGDVDIANKTGTTSTRSRWLILNTFPTIIKAKQMAFIITTNGAPPGLRNIY